MAEGEPAHGQGEGAVTWPPAIDTLRQHMQRVFSDLIAACSLPEDVQDFRPLPDAWTIREVLEHVVLADHFLLLLVQKIADRSGRRAARGEEWPTVEPDFTLLQPLMDHGFSWTHPPHMTPEGDRATQRIAEDLNRDLDRCRAFLDAQPAGEGTLHRIRMSVADAHLNLYQYLALIVLHADRHWIQILRNREAMGQGDP